MITALLSKRGETFYYKGSVINTKDLDMQQRLNLLKEVYNLKLSNFASILNMSPQQFSYKMSHKLSVSEISKISQFLNLNNDQIVNLFIRV